MTFSLTNDSPRPSRKPLAGKPAARQLVLLSGLDCLPGQRERRERLKVSAVELRAAGYTLPEIGSGQYLHQEGD